MNSKDYGVQLSKSKRIELDWIIFFSWLEGNAAENLTVIVTTWTLVSLLGKCVVSKFSMARVPSSLTRISRFFYTCVNMSLSFRISDTADWDPNAKLLRVVAKNVTTLGLIIVGMTATACKNCKHSVCVDMPIFGLEKS